MKNGIFKWIVEHDEVPYKKIWRYATEALVNDVGRYLDEVKCTYFI